MEDNLLEDKIKKLEEETNIEFFAALKKIITEFITNEFELEHKLNGYIDNLSIVELVIKIENEFNIFIDDNLASCLFEEKATFNDLYSVFDSGKLQTENMFKLKN